MNALTMRRNQQDIRSYTVDNHGSLTGNPNLCTMRANFLVAKLDASSFLAPVHTTLPDWKIKAVVRGSNILITTPEKRCGLYSEFRVRKLIFLRSKGQPKLTVETTFLHKGYDGLHKFVP